MRGFFVALLAVVAVTIGAPAASNSQDIPNLRGSWYGHADQVSNERGYFYGDNEVEITYQSGRRFIGAVTHAGGTEKFIGVIRHNNTTFYWVDTGDGGHVFGEVIVPDVIETCYLEEGVHAVAECTILTRRGSRVPGL